VREVLASNDVNDDSSRSAQRPPAQPKTLKVALHRLVENSSQYVRGKQRARKDIALLTLREPLMTYHAAVRLARFAVALFGVTLALGCATHRPLMPTPTIYQGLDGKAVFTDVPSQRKQPAVDLLYITDRARETDPDSDLTYGAERSREIAFGSATVEMGPDLTWSELEQQSRLGQRTEPVNLTLGDVTEIGRFPGTPYPLRVTAEGIKYDADVLAKHEQAKQALTAELERRLDASSRKEIVLYVHGFNETFETAAFTLAELCHFLGREHVCTLFTWPAGIGGFILTAYGYDRESSEFGSFHLKKMIRFLAQLPRVEKIHLLAHSRGTDVLLSALRELMLEAYTSGRTLDVLKLENIILMAPDIDSDIATQRMNPIVSDPDMFRARPTEILPFDDVGSTLTVYTSPVDKALRASSILFRSRRAGQFRPD
jgi:esterase/lipase superfamily enzyme